MRSGELVSLRVGSWLGDRGILRIPAGGMERTKRHGRDVPVGSDTARLLDSLCEGRYHEYWLFHQEDETPLPLRSPDQDGRPRSVHHPTGGSRLSPDAGLDGAWSPVVTLAPWAATKYTTSRGVSFC